MSYASEGVEGTSGAIRPALAVWRFYRALRVRRAPFVPLFILVVMAFLGAFGPYLAPYDPTIGSLNDSLAPPFWQDGSIDGFWLGTDFQGRDLLSRLLEGARITLLSALSGLVGACVIGVSLGLLAGYWGGWIDMILMRIVDIMLAMPGLLVALVAVARFGPSLWIIIVVVVATSWIAYARYVRAEVLSLKEREFVLGAVAIGCGVPRIMFRHLLPNTVATIMVIATLQTGGIILLVASLSFLGLGIPVPTAAWGVMIADGREWLLLAWWISIIPGIAISMLIVSLNLTGDWMRDTFDPRLRDR